ncbi:MAG: hypothetical protein OHK0048_01990 [Rhodoferax sp.]
MPATYAACLAQLDCPGQTQNCVFNQNLQSQARFDDGFWSSLGPPLGVGLRQAIQFRAQSHQVGIESPSAQVGGIAQLAVNQGFCPGG